MPVELNNKHRCRNRGPLRTDLNQYLFRQPAWRNLEGSEGSSKKTLSARRCRNRQIRVRFNGNDVTLPNSIPCSTGRNRCAAYINSSSPAAEPCTNTSFSCIIYTQVRNPAYYLTWPVRQIIQLFPKDGSSSTMRVVSIHSGYAAVGCQRGYSKLTELSYILGRY